MHSFARSLVVSVVLLVACNSGETPDARATLGAVGAAGLEPRQPVEAIRCKGMPEADGARVLLHEARFFADGSVATTCSVEIAGTAMLGSASYAWAKTGYLGAVCEVDVANGYWRFIVVQDHSFSVATHVASSPARWEEWLLPCSSVD